MSVAFDVTDITKWAKTFELAPKQHGLAVMRAVNYVGARVTTKVQREIAKQSGLQYGRVSSALKITRATVAKPVFEINAKGGFFSLRAFAARQTKGGVSARPWGKRRVFPNTFIIDKLGGQVFKRTAEGRLKKLWGPAIPVEMMRDRVPEVVKEEVKARLAPRLEHEILRMLPRVPNPV